MPKTIFNIIDESQLYIEKAYTVLIAGLKGTDATATDGTPVLCKTSEELETNFGKPSTTVGKETRALVMANALINQGFYVIFVGFDSKPVAEKLTWSAWVGDRNSNDLRFACTGDFAGINDMALITVCANRGGCIALLDCDEIITPKTGETIATTIQKAFSTKATDSDSDTYAAGFAPWGKFDKSVVTTDFKDMFFPGSFAYLLAFGNSVIINKNPDGFAVAGSQRGVIPGYVEPKYQFDAVDINVLQRKTPDATSLNDISGVAVNPICYIRTLGNVVWGNRTMKANVADTKADSLLTWGSFLNITHIVCDITDKAWLASKKYTFEQNNDILWVNFKGEITPTLDKLQSGSQVLAYRISKLTSKGKARLNAQIDITPIEAVEDFKINVNLTDSISVEVQ